MERRRLYSQKDISVRDLQAFAENVLVVPGPPVRILGITLTTRMIIVKLADGSLWVNSPVSLPFDMLVPVKAMGPVRYLVAADQDARLATEGVVRIISRRL